MDTHEAILTEAEIHHPNRNMDSEIQSNGARPGSAWLGGNVKMKTTYRTLETGQRIRLSPQRPWRGKSERRQVLKQRRLEREASKADARRATATWPAERMYE